MKKTNEQYRENMKKLMSDIIGVSYDDMLDIKESLKKLSVLQIIHNHQEVVIKELFSDLNALADNNFCDSVFLIIFAREIIGYVTYCKNDDNLVIYVTTDFCQQPVIDDVVSKLRIEYQVSASNVKVLDQKEKH